MESQKKDLDVICESCKKPFFESTILRHVAKSKSCKAFYGSRFKEMKKEKGRQKALRFRYKTPEAHDKLLKKERDSYANNTCIKEKRRENYQKNKEKIKEENKKNRTRILSSIANENAEKISKVGKIPNILQKASENLEDLKKIFESQ